MKAIHDTGNNLTAALDPNDSVGIIDSYFPNADFFTEFERFDRHLDKLHRLNDGNQIDYVSICSPNYLHDSHMRFALRTGADAICEKPIVLNPGTSTAFRKSSGTLGARSTPSSSSACTPPSSPCARRSRMRGATRSTTWI